MPRAIWSGAITFGLVNVPVRMYSAISEHKLHFHYIHERDSSPIGYQKICKQEDKPVPDAEIVKAFEYEKGEYVFMEDEDFEAARVQGYKTIDITDFVPYQDIDPIYFAKTYYLGPQDGAEKVYSLLVRAMEDSELAGIAKFVMRDRQYLGCLRVRNGVITLEQLYFADEVDPPENILPGKLPKVEKRELDMASRLIESFSGDWKPEKYEDTYHDALMEIVKAKRKGQEVHRVQEPEEEGVPDLLEALRMSLEQSKGGRSRRNGARRNGSRRDGTSSSTATKEELQEQARKLGIEGRSKMSKAQLAKAVASAK